MTGIALKYSFVTNQNFLLCHNLKEVYELYQLCSTGKDLKEFCIDAGVNYNKFIEWQRKQHWNAKLGRMEEVQLPVMSAVSLTHV